MNKMIFFILISSTLAQSHYSAISNCLIKKSFYHIPSASCVQFPSYDLCPKGEWVVHGPTPGTAVCGPLIDCPPGEVPTLAPEGGERCSCPHGTYRRGTSCHHLFTQADCRNGELLLPENLKINDKICPHKFSCKQDHECKSYQKTKTEIAVRGTVDWTKQVSYLKEMVCQKDIKSICCPEDSESSMISPEVLLASLIYPSAVCGRNPCPQDHWPFLEESWNVRCLKKSEGLEQCQGTLTKKNGQVVCDTLDDAIRGIAPTAKDNECGRRRVWKYEKCVRIF